VFRNSSPLSGVVAHSQSNTFFVECGPFASARVFATTENAPAQANIGLNTDKPTDTSAPPQKTYRSHRRSIKLTGT
jgi:hypothetical protein